MRRGASRMSASRKATAWVGAYLQRSHEPLPILLFVLPLLILYEVGTYFCATDHVAGTEHRLVAYTLLQRFFHLRLWRASSRFVPPLAVAGILLAWHVVRRDPWKLELNTPTLISLESLLLCLPLMAICRLTVRYLPLSGADDPGFAVRMVYSLGAGVYEELLFRLILFGLLSFILIDWLKFERNRSTLAIVCLSSILFALYHYLGTERFRVAPFVFRTLAGGYFGVIYLYRGFGVTVGTHTFYDVIIVMSQSAYG